MNDHIPMPSRAEREASVQAILDKSLPPVRPCWKGLPLSALVFGVEDCLFLALLLGLLPALLGLIPAEIQVWELLPVILFLTAPLLYAAAQVLAMWKESLSGTLDWKRTCRLPLQTLLALRMLLFGGLAVLVCVPVNLLLWHFSGGELPLLRMLGISFASLFLYAALSLACRRLRWGLLVPAVLWALAGQSALWANTWTARLLRETPAAVFFLLAGAGLAYCLKRLRVMLRSPQKGEYMYAFR